MNPEALSFSTFVTAHEDGGLHHDLTEKMNNIVADLNNSVLDYAKHGGCSEIDEYAAIKKPLKTVEEHSSPKIYTF